MVEVRDTIAYMRHIFLVGLSGSGKSTVGRLLAQRLGIPFLDSDTLIEAACEEQIPSIFAHHGEAYFRACESDVFADAIHTYKDGAVIATGGGAVVWKENRVLMAEHGIRIWLQTEPSVALERLYAQQATALAQGIVPETRPLLTGSDPLTTLQALAATRLSLYEEAELMCNTAGKTREQVAQEVIAMLTHSGVLDSDGVAPIVRHVLLVMGTMSSSIGEV